MVAGFQFSDRFFSDESSSAIRSAGSGSVSGNPTVVRFEITPPEDAPISMSRSNGNDLAISPDGSRVVYSSGNSVTNYQFYLQAIGRPEIAPLRGMEGGVSPFFSPSGEWVGFTQTGGDRILKVSVFGGIPVSLTEVEYRMVGWSWGADDRIVYGTIGAGLFSVAGAGGEPKILTTLDTGQGESGHVGPHVIDGEDLVLFVINAGGMTRTFGQLAVLDRGSGEVTRLGLAGISPRYVSTGHIVYATSDGSVRAVPFDVDAQEVTGSPVPLVEGVSVKNDGSANFDISDDGRLVYMLQPPGLAIPTNLVRLDRDGTRSLLAELESFALWPRFSRDGLRVAYALSEDQGLSSESDLWVLDVTRGAKTRVTFGGNNGFYPLWSPDEARLTHADGIGNQNRLLLTRADGSYETEVLFDLDGRRFPTSWSPDGRTLAYYVGPAGTPTGTRDLWMLTVDGGTPVPAPYVVTPFTESGGIFSPDGQWVAYVSDKAGENGVYARPFPGPGTEITVSVGFGQEPVWGPSGSDELFYRTAEELMVVSVDLTSPTLSVGKPARVIADLFRRDTGSTLGGMANYDIAPDGQSFVMVENRSPGEGPGDQPLLYVVLNWFEELRERVPTN